MFDFRLKLKENNDVILGLKMSHSGHNEDEFNFFLFFKNNLIKRKK